MAMPPLLPQLVLLAAAVSASQGEVADRGALDKLSEELACDLSRYGWRWYHDAYRAAEQARHLPADAPERDAARVALAEALLDRTANVTDVLACNVGVVGGYLALARLASPLAVETLGVMGNDRGEAGLAYRLLQLALIWIFTLRNANRIPEGPGAAWGFSETAIIPAIMQLKKGNDRRMREDLRRKVPISPSFRDRTLEIAVVSICAYPPDHPLALPKVTPINRDSYAQRHGYHLRLHLEPPVIGAHDLGVQHAKLATMLAYLQSGEFDWVAWLDCDSIIMNMDRTLDSIIYQYAQSAQSDGLGDEPPPRVCGEAPGLPDISGEWLDSFVPADMQEEGAVRIEQDEDGSIDASAAQFGAASGRVRGDSTLELAFGEGALSGRIVVSTDGSPDQLEWENGAVWIRRGEPRTTPDPDVCREPCVSPEGCDAQLDPNVDLIVTEEGWGLSSANWMIRRSAWSINFLNSALDCAHVEMRLFGDQDAIILHVMNEQALRAAASLDAEGLARDPLDAHAALVPQFELNSYDALNALTMDCDTFVEGDLLVTFPQCKDAEGCNDVFNLAADYSKDPPEEADVHAGAWWLRSEGQPNWHRYSRTSSAAIRIFGPRPIIRDIFFREQSMRGQA